MKIFVNRKIKLLFAQILLSIGAVALLMLTLFILFSQYGVIEILVCSALLCGLIFAFLYQYFKEQSNAIESATERIDAYLSGDHEVRLASDEDGELYRLFHEVNTLVSVLNAHAENESRAKQALPRYHRRLFPIQLKTPLAALNIYVGIMQEEAKEQPVIKEFTDLSEQELDRIDALVQNLLKIAKLDAGTITFEKQEESVPEMMDTIKKQFSLRCRQEGKSLDLSGDEELSLLCDRAWFMEAISNLVKNAFDHTEAGDTIRIAWKQSASLIQITVKDTGCGVHPEDLYHIFKRFYRSRFSKDTQGVGLGLPLAKAVIEEQGGAITVDSELNVGTTFTINFLTSEPK